MHGSAPTHLGEKSSRNKGVSAEKASPSTKSKASVVLLDLAGQPCVVDTDSGEVLGRVWREVRGGTARDPEGRARKVRNFAAKGGDAAAEESVKRGLGKTDQSVWKQRAKRREDLQARMGQVGGFLIESGHMVPDGDGGYTLRDLGDGELVPDRVARLRRLYDWLKTAWREVGRCCTRAHSTDEGDDIRIQRVEGEDHLSGLIHCDRHLCPICVGARSAQRRKDLLEVLDQIPADAQLVLKVFTARHRFGTILTDTEKRVRVGVRAIRGLRSTKKATYGHVTTLELTFGKNGHHPHLNVLEAYRPEVDLEERKLIEAETYTKAVKDAGGTVDLDLQESEDGSWWRVVDRTELLKVAYYITKEDGTDEAVEGEEELDVLGDSITHELTGGHRKRGKTIPTVYACVDAYAEAWCAKGLTWFSRGGCFMPAKKDTEGQEEEQQEEAMNREREGVTVGWLRSLAWRRLSPEGQAVLGHAVKTGLWRENPYAVMDGLGIPQAMWGCGSPPKKDSPPDD